ncbi:hypothetical protein ACQ7HM_11830 [Williamsia sp. MIQD14]|uniref:hypothetical protein n=1 Tax=Williamsia sp. MIQD14 TaxID=3425703 RepID=UPI003D9FEAC2
MSSQRTRRVLITALALVAWTSFAGIYVNFGRFAVSDTSCDGGEIRASTFGLVYLTVVAVVWMIPFVVLAVSKRSTATIVLVVVAILLATGVVLGIASRAGEFCF